MVGGTFTALQVESRNRLMDYNPATFSLNAFAPLVNNAVNTLAVDQNNLLIGGNFSQIEGQARSRLASYNYVSDNLNAWNPGADASVNDILQWNDTMMVAGDFEVHGRNFPDRGIGAFDLSSGNLLAWNPQASGDGSRPGPALVSR